MDHVLSRNKCNPEDGQHFVANGTSYTIRGKLGDGAAGLVRRAVRQKDGGEVAIKFLAPDPKYIDEAMFNDVAARFQREGERGTQLRHGALVAIHAYVENTNGSAFPHGGPTNPFIVMDIVKGRTLEALLRTGPKRALDGPKEKRFELLPERLSIAVDIAEALKYLHQKRLVHRDVKPANVFLPSVTAKLPEAKLGDFGIMKWGDFHESVSTGALTMTHQQGLGTFKYMSPEQAISPKDVGVRSDIYSLGITLFELFTGQILASPHHVFEVMNARLLRGTTASRFISLGYHIQPSDEPIAELILNMHLRGVSGRPPIDKVLGRLAYELERRGGDR